MDWFEQLTGFREGHYADTQARLSVENQRLNSTVNGRSYSIGRLDVLSLGELRARANLVAERGRLSVRNVSADVRSLHRAHQHRGALFQVASQFNLLEMVGPTITPEHGVTRYSSDRTQGPACAIAAGAATIYRNYFVPIAGHLGQTADRQIDAAAELRQALASALGVSADDVWSMRNGYALPKVDGLQRVRNYLGSVDEATREELKNRLRIGLHSDVEVTDGGSPEQIVSQAFCSAMPVSYSGFEPNAWEPLARLVLEAAYEATLAAAALTAQRSQTPLVFLTRLGGGAFGNDDAWIDAAIRMALGRFRDYALEAVFVSYGPVPPSLRALEGEFPPST
ncbi:hypothetical protein [Phenylobacterium sp.]|uniref:hypothetical protein n=1 Tax=Phenylobacterium sp. TaxID=1871053 RepID=UPI0035C8223D